MYGNEEALKMRYNPFTAQGKLEVKDTPYKGLKRYASEDRPFGERSKLNGISDNVIKKAS
jgi:hypothetical protein